MIAAIDVHYRDDASATAGAVVFSDFSDSEGYRTYIRDIPRVEDYIPGQFYKRELPCIMTILGEIEEEIDIIIIDGYVDLGYKPGLGMHLWKVLAGRKRVIGVAKKHYRGTNAVKIYRGKSRQPLYVTAAGIEPSSAASMIEHMHNRYRLPSLLKQTDTLSRYKG